MTLTSLSFYLLVLALLVLYYLVPKRFQWVVLLIGSYAFYAFVCLRYMGFIVITTLTTYFGARGMDAMTARMEQTVAAHKQDWERDERKAYKKRCKSRRKALMIGILVFNFGILAVLKYYNFFAESMEALFASMGLTVSLGHIGLLLPLGISFYTFQSMGYVLDVYREKVPAERNVGKLALFVSFFPQIIQGPIGVYDQLAHQLYDAHKYNFDNIRYGAELILWGFFKKLVIADRAVGMIHTVAGAYTDYAGTYVLLAALVYALQLYADFSGGIDISRGVAQMFGITMGENFRRPYFSRTLTEYWHRWHISLSTWFRDYLLYPILRSRGMRRLSMKKSERHGRMYYRNLATMIATTCVWAFTGLWHGASWNFVLWGLYFFVLLAAEKTIGEKRLRRIPTILRRVGTMLLVILGWNIFYFTDLTQLLQHFGLLFGLLGAGFSNAQTGIQLVNNLPLLLVCAIGATSVPQNLGNLFGGVCVQGGKRSGQIIYACVTFAFDAALLALSTIALVGSTYNAFLYFRF